MSNESLITRAGELNSQYSIEHGVKVTDRLLGFSNVFGDETNRHALYAIMTLSVVILSSLIPLSFRRLAASPDARRIKKTKANPSAPPTFHFSQDDIAFNGRDIYRKLLREHGPVICVPRCGREEYLLDGKYARQLFCEHQTFLFEPAILQLLNLEWAMNSKAAHSHVGALSGFIQQSMSYLPQIVDRMAPRIYSMAEELEQDGASKKTPDGTLVINDIYEWCHRAVARATVAFVYGEEYLESSYVADTMEYTANSIRRLSGVDRATSWTAKNMPTFWKYSTIFSEILFVLVPRYYLGLLPRLWRRTEQHMMETPEHSHDGFVSVYSRVCQHYYRNRSKYDLWTFLQFSTHIMLGMTFGSIHQSANNAVWVLFYLAQRQENLEEIRKEIKELLQDQAGSSDVPNVDTLNRAVKLDSFIHEVMRHKGDTYGPPRELARDTKVGPYVVPKGANMQVVLFTVHENEELYKDALKFDPYRAMRINKPAHMVTESYLPFGLSKWACPGRTLAIAEIKLIVTSLILRYDVRLEDNRFTIRDPITTTAVAPIGRLLLHPLQPKA